MTPNRPGNEPDADDMATDPAESVDTPDLPEEEAEQLGDFA